MIIRDGEYFGEPNPRLEFITMDSIEEGLRFIKPSRNIVLHTGVGGYDMFQEAVEGEMGFVRVVIGFKVPRILRRLKGTIHKSPTGKYYKLIKK